MEPFQIRLNCVDHYQANPSEFDPPLPYKDGHPDKGYRPKVPVIRTFGTTETGQKICVHVHGAFPYLYVQYDGDVSPEAVRSAARSLHLSIDHALAISYRRNTYDKKAAFVAHITLVKGVPFYGYHVGYRFFFKIYLLNPNYITRLADLLLQGAVMKRPIQPYESHLQYIPQWMCDYSLYGCAPMKCSKVRFRAPIPEYLDLPDFSHRWHDRSIPSDWISDESILPKQSHCQLEADVCVQDILNRLEIKERSLHHDFSEFVKPAASEEKLVPSLAGLWQDEKRRRKKRLGLLDPDSSPFSTEDLVSFSVDPRKTSEGDWIHGDEFQRLAQQIAAEERRQDSEQDVTLDDLLHKRPFETDIKTALESIEDFYPGPNGFVNLQLAYVGELDHTEETVQDYVDENALQSPELDADSYSEDDSMVDIFSEDEDEVAEVNMLDDMSDNGETESRLQTNGEHTSMLSVEPQTEQNQPNLDYPGGIRETDFWDKRFNKSQMVAQDNLSATRSKHNTANVLQALDRTSSMPLKSSPLQTKQPTAETDNAMDGSMSGSNEDHQTSQGGSALSQSTIRPRGNGLNSTLNFPVVKDPSDPMTILRFSQEASSSKNLQSLLEKEASSPTKSEDISKLISSTGTDVSSADGTASEIAALLYDAFSIPPRTPLGCLRRSCPSPSEVTSTLHDYGHPSIVYPRAHYSNDSDVPDRPREYAGREFRLEGTSVRYLPDFDPSGRSPALLGEQAISRDRFEWQEVDHNLRMASTSRVWEFAPVPPSRSEVITWFENQQHETLVNAAKPKGHPKEKEERGKALSQIEAPTQKNDFGFKYSQNKSTRVEHQAQYMSTMSLEVHVNTRGGLSPNPEEDEISSFFWCITSAEEDLEENGALAGAHVGVVFQGEQQPESKISKALRIDWEHEQSELDLINRLIDIVRLYDPDIITGYEVHNSSWGYIIERARKKYDFDLCDELSRVKSQAHGRFGREADKWGFNHTSSIRVTGRHIINIWRAMRSELNLLQYTMENVVFHLLHWRIPHYSFRDLTAWFQSDKPRDFMKVVNYYTSRVQINIEILEENELIPRTSEQARLLGIDFFSVFSRGSQFKVESLMFRIAKPENFILVSPSRKQVGQQNALECLPLVMEPQSDFYTSPLLVLDFQSLYPSIMIAYNYCYSTFLGRVQSWRGRNKMGFTDYNRQPRLLELLRDHINIAPNGMMYAKPEVRKSLLAKMLAEILETRVMVKAGMKMDKDDRALQRLLNNRQLALKLIANVTYGYTSASFSGRMPCSEIADSIVQSGRETLEKAIAFIHSVERWGAEVVYGDTDSLFVYLKGRTREEAFDIGEEIAKAVTQINPHPVKLKFEKVYHPCVLLAKKRYVGFKYEHRDQKEPEFDAKGIETVRRDGTPAEQKIEERILKLLFRTADLSQVKSYFQSQCMKIMQGRVSVQDFCFARAVKLGTYSERGTLPAGALISTKRMLEDPRAEPQYGERVPYVVVTGAPGSRLIDRCVPPETLLQDAQLDLDAEYYITKNLIPPLERILNLVGANVRQWYDEMPKFHRMRRVEGTTAAGRSSVRTLETYMKSSTCIVCKAKLYDTEMPFCPDCLQQPHVSLLDLVSRLRQAEQKVANLERVCRSCMDVPFGDEVKCDSLDCPVFYARTRSVAHWKHTSAVLGPLIKFLQDNCGVGLEW